MQRSIVSGRPDESKRWPLHAFSPLVPALVLIPIAVSISYTFDFGLAYQGGVEAWASGHPQRVVTWTGTPFLAVVMGAITRAASLDVSARVFMGVNLLVWAGLLASVWNRLRPNVPSRWWWATLIAAGVFAPVVSTIFWLSFNLMVFVLALGGFILAGRRNRLAGLLIGLSVAMKPILALLLLALLFRRHSRSAGVWAVAVAGGLSFFGLGFLAWRAGDLQLLNPFPYIAAFLSKGGVPTTMACVPENYSPSALLCRLGAPTSSSVTVVVAAGVLVSGWLLIRRLPDSSGPQWELFGAAGLLSPMLGPIGWSNYGVLMAPLFLLLAYQFWAEHAPPLLWISLAVSFLLAELVWDPLESLAQTPVPVVLFTYALGQFAQYFLLLTWIRWRLLRHNRPDRAVLVTSGGTRSEP